MRISTGYLFNGYSDRIADAQARFAEAQERVLTGKRFQRASEDPSAAATVLHSRSLRSAIEQFSENLNFAKGSIGASENALDEAHTLMRRGYELALRAANDINSPESLEALAKEAEHLRDRLVEIANSRGSDGQYIFSGHKSDTKPFVVDSTGLRFDGDTNAIYSEVAPGELMRTNMENADTFFTGHFDALTNLVADIRSGNEAQISDRSVAAMQDADAAIGAARGALGADLQRIARMTTAHAERVDDLTAKIADVQEIDFAVAVQEMKGAQLAYQAALTVTSRGLSLSLMDFMR